jgi:hypothetical protein
MYEKVLTKASHTYSSGKRRVPQLDARGLGRRFHTLARRRGRLFDLGQNPQRHEALALQQRGRKERRAHGRRLRLHGGRRWSAESKDQQQACGLSRRRLPARGHDPVSSRLGRSYLSSIAERLTVMMSQRHAARPDPCRLHRLPDALRGGHFYSLHTIAATAKQRLVEQAIPDKTNYPDVLTTIPGVLPIALCPLIYSIGWPMPLATRCPLLK